MKATLTLRDVQKQVPARRESAAADNTLAAVNVGKNAIKVVRLSRRGERGRVAERDGLSSGAAGT